jgi:hypothetical protein
MVDQNTHFAAVVPGSLPPPRPGRHARLLPNDNLAYYGAVPDALFPMWLNTTAERRHLVGRWRLVHSPVHQ